MIQPEHQHDERSEYIGVERSHDPIAQGWAEGPRFTRAGLKDGYRLTPLQRFGFGLLAAAYLVFGGWASYAAVLNHQEGSRFAALSFALLAAALFFVGAKTIQNVLSFSPPHK